MNLSMKGFSDPYLRTTDEIKLRVLGLSLFDNLMREGGAEFPRMLSCAGYESEHFKKYENQRLAKGAAVGIDENFKLAHFWLGRGLKFVGFLGDQSAEEAGVRTRGTITLHIPGVKADDRGKKVYCLGPNEFSLSHKTGAAEIGKIVYVDEDLNESAHVFHKRFDDERPEDLTINRR